MSKNSGKRSPFLTIGMRMRNFGRSLMRSYVMPTQATPPKTSLPPSWSTDAQTPLVWRKEAPPSPAEDSAEMTGTPQQEDFVPQRPTPPIRQRPTPAPQPQRQPVQRARTQSEIDATLSKILAFHQEREAKREQIREERQAKAAPDISTKPDTNLRRRRAAVEYVETTALQSPEDKAVQKQEPKADIQRELPASPVDEEDEEPEQLPPIDTVPPDTAVTTTTTPAAPIQRQPTAESSPTSEDYDANDIPDSAATEDTFSDNPELIEDSFIETPPTSGMDTEQVQRSSIQPTPPKRETHTPIEQVQRAETASTPTEAKPSSTVPPTITPEPSDHPIQEIASTQSESNLPTTASPIEDNTTPVIDTQPRVDASVDAPVENIQRASDDIGLAAASDVSTSPEAPHGWQDDEPYTNTIQRETIDTPQPDTPTFPDEEPYDWQDDTPYADTIQRQPVEESPNTPASPDVPTFPESPHDWRDDAPYASPQPDVPDFPDEEPYDYDWQDDVPYIDAIQRDPLEASPPSQVPTFPASPHDWRDDAPYASPQPNTPTFPDEEPYDWQDDTPYPDTIQRQSVEASPNTPAQAADTPASPNEEPYDWQDDTLYADTIQRDPLEAASPHSPSDILTFPKHDRQDDAPYADTQPDTPAFPDEEPYDDTPYPDTIQRDPLEAAPNAPAQPDTLSKESYNWQDDESYADTQPHDWQGHTSVPDTTSINQQPSIDALPTVDPGELTETSLYFSAPEETHAEPHYSDYDLQKFPAAETDSYTESPIPPTYDASPDFDYPSESAETRPTSPINIPDNLVEEFARRVPDETNIWRAPEIEPLDSEFITHVPASWGTPNHQPTETIEPAYPMDTASPASTGDASYTPEPASSPETQIVQRTPASDTEFLPQAEDSTQSNTEDNAESSLDVFQALIQSGAVPSSPGASDLPDISRQTIYEIEQRIAANNTEDSVPPPDSYSDLPQWPETLPAPPASEPKPAAPSISRAAYTNTSPPVKPPPPPQPSVQPPSPIGDQIMRVEEDSDPLAEPNSETGEDSTDIDQLARDVYRILRKRLRVEHERRNK